MQSNKAAWVQGTLLVAGVAAVGLTLALRLRRPFDPATLAVQVSQLRSSAAEAQLLLENARAGRLAPGFVRQHARQMAAKVDATNGKLGKPAQPGLTTQKTQAQHLGTALEQALSSLGQDARPPRDPAFGRLADALDALDRQLQPGGG